MTSLFEAQTKRIQELDELVVTFQKVKGGLLAELNNQRANMNKLQTENKRFRERKRGTLGISGNGSKLCYSTDG